MSERTIKFSLDVLALIESFPSKRRYWVIGDQLLRSATSIGANIAESKGSLSKKDYRRFWVIALRSANETTYWLNLLMRIENNKLIDQLSTESMELAKIINYSVRNMKGD